MIQSRPAVSTLALRVYTTR